MGRPPASSRRLVIEPARSGGKSTAAQSALTPMPTTAPGDRRRRRGPTRPGRPRPCAAAIVAVGDDVVGPLQASGPSRGRPRPRRRRASPARRSRQAPGMPRRQRHGPEAEPNRAVPRPAAPSRCGRAGHGPRSARRRPRRHLRLPASSQSRTMGWVESTAPKRSRRAGEGRSHPAAAAGARSAVSGCSSCERRVERPRRPGRRQSSAMMQVMRISRWRSSRC